jgi:hypothetical protein
VNTPPPTPPASPFFKPMTLGLACVGLALTTALPLLFAHPKMAEYRMWNVSVIGALALFTAARLGFWQGVAFTAVAIALKDVCLYATTEWWQPYPLSWLYFTGYVLIGWVFMRRSASVGRAVGVGLGAGLAFFFVSNFVAWLEQAYPYGYSLEGLVDCYIAGIPFARGTFVGDVCFTAAFFGAHAVLSRAYFPAERVGAVAEEARQTEGHW